YRCTDSHKRKTCPRSHPLREDQIAGAVVRLVKTQLSSRPALAYLQEQHVRRATNRSREQADEAKPLKASLRETQKKVDNLVASIASGELSGVALGPVQRALDEAEGLRKVLTAKLHALEAETDVTVSVPT